MRHPWFNDVLWSHVLSKTIKPPLVPDITQKYLDNDEGDDEDGDNNASRLSFFGGGTPSALSKRENGRRHSYYIHSTVFLPS